MSQRTEAIRSRAILDSARGARCTLRFPVCSGDPEQTVSCHIHDASFGLARKADDCSTVFGCANCHEYLDRRLWIGRQSREDVLETVLSAVLETQSERIRRGIYSVKLDAPKPFHERAVKPRKPAEQRKPIPQPPTTQWPKRELRSRNDLRKEQTNAD